MKIKALLLFLLTLISLIGNCQKSANVSKLTDKTSLISIESLQNDSINFLLIRNDSTLVPKANIIFIQGSLPIPLIIKEEGYGSFIPSLNFDFLEVAQKYNIIVISKPNTPVIADVKNLNDKYCYIPDSSFSEKFDSLYLKYNYRDNYISRTNEVIKYLKDQKWSDSSNIYIVGHSEGASVAVGVAFNNHLIKAVGYLSGNPMGRYAQYINTQRKAELKGQQTSEQSQVQINSLYKTWGEICSSSINNFDNDPTQTWISFSKPIINEIVNMKCPIFIGYGTEDPGGQFCDYLPIYLDITKKTKYNLSPYIGRGHNFEKIVEGKSDFNDMIWEKVMNDFLFWIESL